MLAEPPKDLVTEQWDQQSYVPSRCGVRSISIGEAKAAVARGVLQTLVHVLPETVEKLLTMEDPQVHRLMAYETKVRQ